MYYTKPLFPYADGYYTIMPTGLPKRFYPTDKENTHTVGSDVICFINNPSEEIKKRLIADYTAYCRNKSLSGLL